MSNVILSAGNGGYIAGLVIELLIIVAAGVFIFLTLSGKLSKKAVPATGEIAEEGEEPAENKVEEGAAAEAAAEPEPMMAEEVPIPEKKAKKSKKAEPIEEESEPEAKKSEAASEAEVKEEAEVKPEKKEPVKRKIKIRLNIKGTDGSDILSQDVTPTENGGEEEAKIDLNIDDLTKKIDETGNASDEHEEKAAADVAADEPEPEEEPAKTKKSRKKSK